MASNFSNLKRDIIGRNFQIKGTEIIDENRNLKNIRSAKIGSLTVRKDTTINGNLTVQGTITSETPYNAVILLVPTQYATLSDAINYAFASDVNGRFRIILETQGPHNLPPLHYASNTLEYLSIESASITSHMGTYYGHNSGAYNRLGLQGLININNAGCGPYNIALSSGNTIITVTGTEVPYPLGFGNGVVEAPGWIFGLPPGVLLGITPIFNASSDNIIIGDVIRWFDASTNLVTEHTITNVASNALTVTPAIPNTVIQGCGFSIKPRATINVGVAPLAPSIAFGGQMRITGVHFESVVAPPFPAILSILMATSYIQQCLMHIELMSSSGGKMYALAPNTFMDNTNGAAPAKLWSNSTGSIHAFCQNFVGPEAGFGGRAGNKNNMCFSLWIRNNVGVSLSDTTTCKCDGAEFYWCNIGANLKGSSSIEQALWFTKCSTGIVCRDNSTTSNGDITEYGPLPVTPLVFDGQGSGVGLDLDFNCQVSTTSLRLRGLTTHAIIDGNSVIIANVSSTPTVVSNTGVGSYGTHLSAITFENSDNSA